MNNTVKTQNKRQMDKLLNNLYIYEIILLFLGIFLFMLLCVALAFLLWKGQTQNIKKLLYFFVIAIVMIAYPSIQEIQIENDRIAFTKYKDQVRENPNDTVAIDKLEKLLTSLENRASTPEDRIELAEAYVLTENPKKAIEVVDKGIQKEATIDESDELRREHLNSFQNLRDAATLQKAIVDKSTTNSTISVDQLNQIKTLNPKTRSYFNQKYMSKSVIRDQ